MTFLRENNEHRLWPWNLINRGLGVLFSITLLFAAALLGCFFRLTFLTTCGLVAGVSPWCYCHCLFGALYLYCCSLGSILSLLFCVFFLPLLAYFFLYFSLLLLLSVVCLIRERFVPWVCFPLNVVALTSLMWSPCLVTSSTCLMFVFHVDLLATVIEYILSIPISFIFSLDGSY